jgi:hypothetical protein
MPYAVSTCQLHLAYVYNGTVDDKRHTGKERQEGASTNL